MNKFKHVQWGPLCRLVVPAWGCLYSEVKCIMGNGHMVPPPVDRQTGTTKNITFPQPRWWAVRIKYLKSRRWIMYMAKILQLHNRYDQDSLQKLWFKLLSSRTSFAARGRGFGQDQWLNQLCPIFGHSQLNCLPCPVGAFFARFPAPLPRSDF